MSLAKHYVGPLEVLEREELCGNYGENLNTKTLIPQGEPGDPGPQGAQGAEGLQGPQVC